MRFAIKMTWSSAPDKGHKVQYFRPMPNPGSRNIIGEQPRRLFRRAYFPKGSVQIVEFLFRYQPQAEAASLTGIELRRLSPMRMIRRQEPLGYGLRVIVARVILFSADPWSALFP